jgi:peptidyl-prolyl cis-trans isomerase C
VQSVLADVPRIKVSVNGVEIPHATISREAQNHPASTPFGAWQAAARALVVRELLLQEARRLGRPPSPTEDAQGRRETDEEAAIRGLVDSQVATPQPDEASCRRYYDNNRARFRSPEIFECAHILVAARRAETGSDPLPPASQLDLQSAREGSQPVASACGESQAFIAARARAEALRAKLREAPHAFAALAAAHSDCSSRANGGNLGQVTRGMTTREFERALLAMQEGEISDPVESRYGLHIIRLQRRIAGALLPFEAVHERIAAYLTERSQRLAIAQYVARLAAEAKVTGVELASPGDLRVH